MGNEDGMELVIARYFMAVTQSYLYCEILRVSILGHQPWICTLLEMNM